MRLMPKRAFAGAVAVILIASSVVRAQLMEQVPDDALVVIKVKNLAATSEKVGKLFTDLGLAALKPGMDKPLTFLQKELQMEKGVNSAGDMAMVFRDSDITQEPMDKSMVILIPVTDFNAFLSNFSGATATGEVTEVQMPKSEEPGYIAHWGDYAAMSPSKGSVAKKGSTSLKISGAVSNKEMNERDIVVFANFKTLRAKALPHMKEAQEQAVAGMEQEMENNADMAKFKPVARAVISQMFKVAEGFLRDTNGATLSVKFGDEGVSYSLMAEFEPGTYAGGMVAGLKNTDKPLLVGLPAGKYLFYGGHVNQPEVVTKLINDFAAPILKEVEAMGPEMKPAREYMDALNQQMNATTGGTIGVVAPTGALGQEAIFQMVTIARGDAAKIKDAQIKLAQSQNALMKAFMPAADAPVSTVTPQSKTLDGVNFDSIATKLTGQQDQFINLIYGPGGINMLQGEVSKDQLLIAMGTTDQVISETIASIKAGSAPLADTATLKSVTSNLPKQRIGEGFVPLDQIANTAMTYARTFGAPINVKLPEDLPPIGATTSVDGTAIRMEVYVPTLLVQQMVAAGMQVYGQAQGGGGPPGGR